jgi:hypothetical protein
MPRLGVDTCDGRAYSGCCVVAEGIVEPQDVGQRMRSPKWSLLTAVALFLLGFAQGAAPRWLLRSGCGPV